MIRTVLGVLVAAFLGGTTALCATAASFPAFREEERLAERMLPDTELRLSDGRLTRLSALWRDRPLLLTLFYQHCTGTCWPSLLLIRDAAARTGGLGRDYRVLALSFAGSDTAKDMQAQAAAFGLGNDPNWLFAVGAPQDIQRVASTLGFWFRLDPVTGQYDHPTLVVGVVQGRVVRALLGYPISRERFAELLWELRGRFVPYYQLPGQSRLRCFEFDGRTGTMRPDWGMLLLLAPGIVAIVAACAVFGRAATARGRYRFTGVRPVVS